MKSNKKYLMLAGLLAVLFASAKAQILNSAFEDWVIMDTLENPVGWETNNFYVGYFPVKKLDNSLSGNYSLKVSTRAKDLYGIGSWPGCVRQKFVPTGVYEYMTASVRIDSIKMGTVDIRLKQKGSDGFFYKIGGWKRTATTNGATTIWFPVAYTELDTMSLEIWAFNKDEVFGGPNYGYSEVIIDDIAFTNILDAKEENAVTDLRIFPNPAKNWVTVQIHDKLPITGMTIRLYDLQGREFKVGHFHNSESLQLDVSDLPGGAYLIEIGDGETSKIARERLVILD